MLMDDLRTFCSRSWDSYAFLTHVARDPLVHDMNYKRHLDPRGGVSSSGRSDSLQSTPFVEQVVARDCPPRGPSRLGFTLPPSEDEGSASRRRRQE